MVLGRVVEKDIVKGVFIPLGEIHTVFPDDKIVFQQIP